MGGNKGKSAGNLTPHSHVDRHPYPDGGVSGKNSGTPRRDTPTKSISAGKPSNMDTDCYR